MSKANGLLRAAGRRAALQPRAYAEGVAQVHLPEIGERT